MRGRSRAVAGSIVVAALSLVAACNEILGIGEPFLERDGASSVPVAPEGGSSGTTSGGLGPCNPATCPNGCCMGSDCALGEMDVACGTGGVACAMCIGRCVNHTCTGSAACAMMPSFNPLAGIYPSPLDVTITSGPTGAGIYFTTNGTNPTLTSELYTGPIHLTESATVRAIAHFAGCSSPIASTNYQLSATYSVGGTVSGLGGGGTLVLQNNGGDDYSTALDGAFTFTTRLSNGSPYVVTVKTQPASRTCDLANAIGSIGSTNVTNVAITCSP